PHLPNTSRSLQPAEPCKLSEPDRDDEQRFVRQDSHSQRSANPAVRCEVHFLREKSLSFAGVQPEKSLGLNPLKCLPALLLLLAASGCAALIYEIVWLQLLQLVIGSSAISLGLLLAAYMGGLCLGSALLPRIIPSSQHPLRMYAAIELGIAILGLTVL